MNPIIEQIAMEKKISYDDAAHILKTFSFHLIQKIPALQRVFEDILEDAESDLLNEHLNQMISLLQHRNMESFKNWRMPPQTKRGSSWGIEGIL